MLSKKDRGNIMKVLFLHKWLIMGGIERILVNYLSMLQFDKNIQVDVVIDYDTDNNVFHKFIPKSVNLNYLFDKKYYHYRENIYKDKEHGFLRTIRYKILNFKEKRIREKRLMNHILDGGYDVVINFSNHFDPYLDFSVLKCPVIRWQHLALDKVRDKDIRLLNQYDKIITICEDMKSQLMTLIEQDKIEVLFNPIEMEKVSELSNEKMPIEYAEGYLVQVARLDKIKRHIDLIAIFSRLVKSGIREKLLIIGDGPEYINLEKLIKELELQDRCFLLGEVGNPYPYIKNAKLFLHTSEREGLPTVLLESMILNTPVVAMNCPTGPREILDNGRCGVLVEMGNKDEFVLKTLELLEEQDKINFFKNNMAIHMNKFSELEIKKRFISLMYQITGFNNEKI